MTTPHIVNTHHASVSSESHHIKSVELTNRTSSNLSPSISSRHAKSIRDQQVANLHPQLVGHDKQRPSQDYSSHDLPVQKHVTSSNYGPSTILTTPRDDGRSSSPPIPVIIKDQLNKSAKNNNHYNIVETSSISTAGSSSGSSSSRSLSLWPSKSTISLGSTNVNSNTTNSASSRRLGATPTEGATSTAGINLSATKGQPIPANKKRFWGEEKNIDSIYLIYLKKISYTFNQQQSTALNLTHDSNATINADTKDASIDTTPKIPHQSRVKKNFFGYKYKTRSSSFDKLNNSQIAEAERLNRRDLSTGPQNRSKSGTKSTSKISRLQNSHLDVLDNKNVHIKSFNRDDPDTLSAGSGSAGSESLGSGSGGVGQGQGQFLQWETRQIRVLQAATLDHVIKFILLISHSDMMTNHARSGVKPLSSSVLEDERNNVAHIIHVIFCTYRSYVTPLELLEKLLEYAPPLSCTEQFRFVMHYWMDNYPEDLDYPMKSIHHPVATPNSSLRDESLISSNLKASGEVARSQSQSSTNSIYNCDRNSHLIDQLVALCKDEEIVRKAISVADLRAQDSSGAGGQIERPDRMERSEIRPSSVKSCAVLDLDSRFVAQQLTAIDLEKFLSLRPYSLLEGAKSESVQIMIRNFNLLSRHVIVTILKSHSPHTVASHWISIAMNLRKIKNFNSLKAIIAGLTNESIYRLKQTVWSKISRTNMANFKMLSSIVDDVNNQTVLRQTQLIIEGTAKLSVEDDSFSFGTIPYLGTFLTDLNMIDARYQNFIDSPIKPGQIAGGDNTTDHNVRQELKKLINLEKCSKQFEILTQVQLLQKNVIASLYALQRRHHFDRFASNLNNIKSELTRNQHMLLTKPAIPQVARLFRTWFQDTEVSSMTDKQCYEISLTLEQNTPIK